VTSLYIMRHGPAESGTGCADSERALTEAGARLVVTIGEGLVAMGVDIDAVFASPFVRADQTADLVHRALGLPGAVTPAPVLRCGAMPEDVLAEVDFTANTLLVGHLPDVSYLTGYCVTGRPVRMVAFAPGAIACIDFDGAPRAGAGTLRWAMTPEQLAGLAGC
jgi:phosphohistidine phosphatase